MEEGRLKAELGLLSETSFQEGGETIETPPFLKASSPEDGKESSRQVPGLLSEEEEEKLKTYSPLTFAFLGDAVYSLYMREHIVKQENRPAKKLHRLTVGLVSAEAQARAADFLYPLLSEEEQEIYRRGQNAKTNSTAKNASLKEYHKATGLECLMGWLYLRKENERIRELLGKIIEETLVRNENERKK
ncbi:MAG: ribonuclease III [Lachnospiraceae bacterium]|nr:ribonuclease III [Lachnospiraceae bacterium]